MWERGRGEGEAGGRPLPKAQACFQTGGLVLTSRMETEQPLSSAL